MPDPGSTENTDIQKASVDELFTKLGSSPQGLTSAEVQKRRAQYGPNAIAEKKVNVTKRTLEADGQVLLFPKVEVESYWTSLDIDVARVTKRATSRGRVSSFRVS